MKRCCFDYYDIFARYSSVGFDNLKHIILYLFFIEFALNNKIFFWWAYLNICLGISLLPLSTLSLFCIFSVFTMVCFPFYSYLLDVLYTSNLLFLGRHLMWNSFMPIIHNSGVEYIPNILLIFYIYY